MDRNPHLSALPPTQSLIPTQAFNFDVNVASQVVAFRNRPDELDVPLRPVTVKQVQHATNHKTLDNTEAVYIDGTRVKQLTLVVHITQIQIWDTADYASFTFEDGTGRCKARQYNLDAQYLEFLRSLLQLMKYKAIYASILAETTVVAEEGSKQWIMLKILKLTPIEHDGSRVFYHVLKCIQIHGWIEEQKQKRGIARIVVQDVEGRREVGNLKEGSQRSGNNTAGSASVGSSERGTQQGRQSPTTVRRQPPIGEQVGSVQSHPHNHQYPPVRSSIGNITNEDTSSQNHLYPPFRGEYYPSTPSPPPVQVSQSSHLNREDLFAPLSQNSRYVEQGTQTSPFHPHRSLNRNEDLRRAVLASSATAAGASSGNHGPAESVPDSTLQASLSLDDGTAVTTTLVQSPTSVRAIVTSGRQQHFPEWGSFQGMFQRDHPDDPIGLQLTGMDEGSYTAGDESTTSGTQTSDVEGGDGEGYYYYSVRHINEQAEDEELFSLSSSPVRNTSVAQAFARISFENDDDEGSDLNASTSRNHGRRSHSPLVHRRLSRPSTFLGLLDLEGRNTTPAAYQDRAAGHSSSQSVCDDRSESVDTTLAQYGTSIRGPHPNRLPQRHEAAVQSEDDVYLGVQGYMDRGLKKYLDDQNIDKRNRTLYRRMQDMRQEEGGGDDHAMGRGLHGSVSFGPRLQERPEGPSTTHVDTYIQTGPAYPNGLRSSHTSRGSGRVEQPSSLRAQSYRDVHRSYDRLPSEETRLERLDPYEKLSSLERDIIIYMQKKSQNKRNGRSSLSLSLSSSTNRRDSTSTRSSLPSNRSGRNVPLIHADTSTDEAYVDINGDSSTSFRVGTIPGSWTSPLASTSVGVQTIRPGRRDIVVSPNNSNSTRESITHRSIQMRGPAVEVSRIAQEVYEMIRERQGQMGDEKGKNREGNGNGVDIDVRDIELALDSLSDKGHIWMSEDGMFVGLNRD